MGAQEPTEDRRRGERRRGGRPKEFSAVVSLRLPTDLHDELILLALRRGNLDVSVVMREMLRVGLESYLKTHGVTGPVIT